MKKIVFPLLLIFLVSFGTSFGAFSWQLHDFGAGPFDHNNNWAPIEYPWGIGNLPSPGDYGEGGEQFDLEGFHFAKNGSTVNLALTNSFGYAAYSNDWNQDYHLGDIFFGFNGNSYQYAIDVSTGDLYQVDSYFGIPDKPGTYHDYTDIANAAGGWEIESGTVIGSVTDELTFWAGLETNPMQGNGDTWVWEFAFDASLIDGFGDASTVSFHNNLECGNDVINETYGIVPEPGTIVLLGLGLVGIGLIRRKSN